MTTWVVSTTDKKSVEEVEIWVKDGQTIKRTTGFRWGSFVVETNNDEPPEDLDPENPDGVDMYGYFSDNAEDGAELISLDDGWFSEVEYPDDMPEEERERLDELWEEESYSSWEDEGWYNSDTECWFYGQLEIKKEND